MDIENKTAEVKSLLEEYKFLTVKNLVKRLKLSRRQVCYLLYNDKMFKAIVRAPLCHNKKLIWTLV